MQFQSLNHFVDQIEFYISKLIGTCTMYVETNLTKSYDKLMTCKQWNINRLSMKLLRFQNNVKKPTHFVYESV